MNVPLLNRISLAVTSGPRGCENTELAIDAADAWEKPLTSLFLLEAVCDMRHRVQIVLFIQLGLWKCALHLMHVDHSLRSQKSAAINIATEVLPTVRFEAERDNLALQLRKLTGDFAQRGSNCDRAGSVGMLGGRWSI